ncbi:hypothetical protein LXA43DRAFT_521063 [Ganoderma leucocontextum]|nr:hypothetical protein LXA43DRAFT_521063 [Ganoderma leucocontextum]
MLVAFHPAAFGVLRWPQVSALSDSLIDPEIHNLIKSVSAFCVIQRCTIDTVFYSAARAVATCTNFACNLATTWWPQQGVARYLFRGISKLSSTIDVRSSPQVKTPGITAPVCAPYTGNNAGKLTEGHRRIIARTLSLSSVVGGSSYQNTSPWP